MLNAGTFIVTIRTAARREYIIIHNIYKQSNMHPQTIVTLRSQHIHTHIMFNILIHYCLFMSGVLCECKLVYSNQCYWYAYRLICIVDKSLTHTNHKHKHTPKHHYTSDNWFIYAVYSEKCICKQPRRQNLFNIIVCV